MTDFDARDFTAALRLGGGLGLTAKPKLTGLALLEHEARQRPADPQALEALAEAQWAAGQVLNAFGTWNRRIALGDVSGRVWAQIGAAMERQDEYVQALKCYEQSLAVDDTPEVRHQMGRSLFKLGLVDEALAQHRIAAEATDNLSAWLAVATLAPNAHGQTPAQILEARQTFAAKLAASPVANRMTCTPRPRATRDKLRIGYVSSWLEKPNYMRPTWALVNNHDRARVEVHLFSDSAPGAEMIGYEAHDTDVIHNTAALDNTALAQLICETELDVLIDINAYSTPDRLGVFTRAPAPVTLAWQNHFGPSGLPGFHGIIGDRHAVKPGEEGDYTEEVHRLPLSYLTFTVAHRAPPVVDPPCLKNGYFTFGSLCVQYKITPQVIDSWAEMLHGVPDSRLFLANRTLDSGENRDWLADRFAERGIARDRLTLKGGADHYDYLRNYDQMDLALDAFPYNGGTTTVEALWQGVPLLTFDGDRWASRTSASLVMNTHLSEFVCPSRAAMVAMAIDMGNDPDTPARLKALRHGMRPLLDQAPVCDGGAMARAVEDLCFSLVK